MESSFTESIARLNATDILILLLIGAVVVYFAVVKWIPPLMFLLVLSATLVGTFIPVLGDIAPLVRWLVMFTFFILGILNCKVNVSPGYLLYWGYVLLGYVFLLNASEIQYQMQKGILLLIMAVLIPTMYADKSFPSMKASLEAIAIAGSTFCLLNFASLPSFLTDAARFSGFTKGAASLAIFLGGLLPFTFWGIWKSNKWVRILCIFGFLGGITTLIFSGQRTGTIIGLISIVPLFFAVQNRKTIGWSLVIFIVMAGLGVLVYQLSSAARIDYLINRFLNEIDVYSGREAIWDMALNAINATPLVGHGVGGSEIYYSGSFHNTYLEVWYNTGFLGLILFILSQLYFLYKTIHLVLITKDAQMRAIAALALGYMLVYIAMGFFESMGAGSSSINIILYLFLCFFVSKNFALSPSPSSVTASTPSASTAQPIDRQASGIYIFSQLNKGKFGGK